MELRIQVRLRLRRVAPTLTVAVAVMVVIIMVHHHPLDHTEDEVVDAAVVDDTICLLSPPTARSI